MEWILVVVVGVAVLIFALSRLSKPQDRQDWSPPAETARREGYGTPPPPQQQEYRPRAAAPLPPRRLSAKEMLSCLEELRQAGAQWDVIWSRLNPGGDPEVQRLLVEIRGPHMFAPHLALGVIEVGCQRALAQSPDADALAGLQVATHDDRFTR